MPFRLIIDGHTYSTDDLTIDEAVELERELGRGWGQLNPLGSAEQFRAFAVMFLRRDHSGDEAAKIVAAIPLGVALKSAKWVEDDLPDLFEDGIPKAAAAAGTTTSSGSPSRRGAGPPT